MDVKLVIQACGDALCDRLCTVLALSHTGGERDYRLAGELGTITGRTEHEMSENKRYFAWQPRAVLAFTIVTAGAIFAIDLAVPLGYAGGVPYMILILLGWWLEKQYAVTVLALLATVLTALGFFLSPQGADQMIVITNRGLALAAIWLTAALLYKARRTQQALQSARSAAQESEARYAGIIDIANEAIVNTDGSGRIRLFNQGAETIFGYRAEEAIGRHIEILMPRRFRNGHKQSFTGFASGADASSRMGQAGRVTGQRKDGSEFPAEASISKLTLAHEEVLTVVLRDATAHRKVEEAIAARTRFFTAASHDLRQPLHAISLYLQALQEETDQTKGREIIEAIGNSSEAMGTLLDSLLEMSRLDAGIIKPRLASVALADVFERLASEFIPEAKEEALELRVVPSSAWARTDMTLLGPILRNLLSNAIRYTPPGGKILLGARRRGNSIILEVRDNGIGIPTSQQEAIFEEFHQVSNPERDRRQGLGLGLSIVRRLSKLLQHPLELESEPGRGTVFRIELPQTRQTAWEEKVTAPAPGRSAIEGRIALLIEDDAEVVEATRLILAHWRCETAVANSAAAARTLVKQSERKPDFIIADLRLRGNESGVGAIQAVHEALGLRLPALLVTGETDPDRLREAAASGLTLLHKPLTAAKLRVALEALSSDRAETYGDGA